MQGEPSLCTQDVAFVTIMVNTSQSPVYDLELIRSAVKAGSWLMAKSAVQRAEDLGYSIDDVEQVLLSLTKEEFWHVWVKPEDGTNQTGRRSQSKGTRWDVYSPVITALNGEKCQVYLKLSFDEKGKPQVVVRSFHLPWK